MAACLVLVFKQEREGNPMIEEKKYQIYEHDEETGEPTCVYHRFDDDYFTPYEMLSIIGIGKPCYSRFGYLLPEGGGNEGDNVFDFPKDEYIAVTLARVFGIDPYEHMEDGEFETWDLIETLEPYISNYETKLQEAARRPENKPEKTPREVHVMQFSTFGQPTGKQTKETYEPEQLLTMCQTSDFVNKFTYLKPTDGIILEDGVYYSALDGLYTLAYWFGVDINGYTTYDDLFMAVFHAI
jgi:hypothetical protein